MTESGPPVPIPKPPPPTGRSASGPPPPYRRVGLIPSAGPARTWGLVVVGAPLLLIMVLGLRSGGGSGSAGPSGASVGFGASGSSGGGGAFGGGLPSGTPSWQQPVPTTAAPYSEQPLVPYTFGSTDPAATPSATPSEGFPPATGTETPSASAGPQAVVEAYFAALNNHDYQTAWNMSDPKPDSDYNAFVMGYTTTERDEVTVESVQGDVVAFTLIATQKDGTSRRYEGTFTVSGGVITDHSVTQIS